ncbi:protein kinase domain-containing protein [Spirillospora sp. CA-255316]
MDPLQPGDPERVGSHRLLARLGAGGMGVVYLGRSRGGRLVAVKVIRRRFTDDPAYRARFRREIGAARRVTGTFTAPVLDADPDAPDPWLVTAYLPGLTLRDAVTSHGPLPPDSARALAGGLAEALAAVHAAGVVHRDLKPANVMLTAGGPRVIDFGIARPEDGTAVTRAGKSIGTPGFMSPEQVSGEDVEPASDVFTLGAVLAFAASGTEPFGTGSALSRNYRIETGRADLTALTDPWLRALVTDCLHHDPSHRPTAATLLDRLSDADGPPLQGTRWLPAPLAEEIDRRTIQARSLPAKPRPRTPNALPAPAPGAFPLNAPAVNALPASDADAGPRSGVASGGAAPAAGSSGALAAIADPLDADAAKTVPPGASPPNAVPDANAARGTDVGPADPPADPSGAPSRTPGASVSGAAPAPNALPAANAMPASGVAGGVTAEPAGFFEVTAEPSDGAGSAEDGESGSRVTRERAPRQLVNRRRFVAGAGVLAAGGLGAFVWGRDGGRGPVKGAGAAPPVSPEGPPPQAVQRWKVKVSDYYPNLMSAGGLVLAKGDEERVQALDPRTGRVVWKRGALTLSQAAGDVAYLVDPDTWDLTAVRAGSGRTLWKHDLPLGTLPTPGPAIAGSVACFGDGDDKRVRGLGVRDGRMRWTARVGAEEGIAAGDGIVVAVDAKVVGLDARDGRTEWTRAIDAGRYPHFADGLFFVADRYATLHALRAADGAVAWRRPRAAYGFLLQSGGGMLYTDAGGGTVLALRTATGEVVWSRRLGRGEGGDYGRGNVLGLSGGTLHVGCTDRNLYALDPATGRVRWTYAADMTLNSGPVGIGGLAFVATRDGHVHAVAPPGGTTNNGGARAAP